MKKRKLVFLLAAVTCLSVPFAACGKDDKNQSSDYFALEKTQPAYTQAVRYDGRITSTDYAHNLAVIQSSKVLPSGKERITVEAVDLLTGEVLLTETVENSANVSYEQKQTVSISIDYPVLRVARNYPQEEWNSYYERYDWVDNYSYAFFAK